MEEALDKNVLIEQLRSLKEEKIEKQEQLEVLNSEIGNLENTKENGEER